jgi:Carboxypeptidase regulatory-like domain
MPNLKSFRFTAAAILAGVLSACGLFQPAPTQPVVQQPQYTNLPGAIPNTMVSSITPTAYDVVGANTNAITVQFAQPVVPSTVEAAFSFLAGVYTTDLGTQKLTLTAMCNGRWRVRNPTASRAVFTWDVYKTSEKGSGIVPGNSDVFFTTTTGQKTVRVFVNGVQHNTKAANTNACSGSVPVLPGKLSGTFTWSSATEMTFTPTQPLSSGQAYTVFMALAQPFANPFQTLDSLRLTGAGLVNASSLPNDRDGELLVYGEGIAATTSFFIQSNRLEVLDFNPFYAKLKIPAGFLPSSYGVMAANPDGARSTLYPAFTITAGAKPRVIDPQDNARAFVEGYVTNYTTGTPLPGAKVSLNSLAGTLETTTDAGGYYFLRGVPLGKSAFRIEKAGFEPVYRLANLASSTESYVLKLAALEPKSERVTNIGPDGGTHYATDAGAAGPFLQIPAGALEGNVPIQFTQLRDASTLPELPQDGSFLAFAHLGPTGLVFKKPATLFLPLQSGISIPVNTPINIFYFDAKRAEWVDDITSGKISDVNGKLFLEYEINHFTWIGGTWFPDAVTGCAKYPDGKPAARITTNWGVTNALGVVTGSTTRSDIGRDLAFFGHGRIASSAHTVTYSGNGPVSFPCIVVSRAVVPPSAWKPEPVIDFPETDDTAPPPKPECQPRSVKPFAERANVAMRGVQSIRGLSSDPKQVLLADGLYGFSMNIPEWNTGRVDPSSLKLELGGVDVTSEAEFVFPSPIDPTGLQIKLTLTEPVRAQAGLNVKLSGSTREGETQEATTTMDVAARLSALPVQFVRVGPYSTVVEDLEAEGVSTPVHLVNEGAVIVLYKEGDSLAGYEAKVPVVALDEAQQIIDIDRPNITFDTSDWAGASATTAAMVDGTALVPVRFDIQDPTSLKMDVSHVRVGVGGSQALGLKPQVLWVLVPITVEAIKGAAIIVGGVIVATTAVVYLDNQRNAGVLPFPVTSPVLNFPVCRKPLTISPVILPTTNQAPFRDTAPLTISDLAKPSPIPCNPNWTPPDPNALADLMMELTNTRQVNANRIDDPSLLNSLNNGVFKYRTPDPTIMTTELNQITGLERQVNSTRQGGLPPIRDIATAKSMEAAYKAAKAAGTPIPYPQNAGATQHAHVLRQMLDGVKQRLVAKGERGPNAGKNTTARVCYSNRDLDFLYALYRLIQDALTKFDGLGPW